MIKLRFHIVKWHLKDISIVKVLFSYGYHFIDSTYLQDMK